MHKSHNNITRGLPAVFTRIKKTGMPFFQPKLSINQPNDIYEQEADAMADKVMLMPMTSAGSHPFFTPVSNSLSSGRNQVIRRKCAHCEEEEKLQRKEKATEAETNEVLENYIGGLSGSGSDLPGNTKAFFENRMGYDFSNVKIHADVAAAKSANSINALAYTSGNNIIFNQNQYSPESDTGKRLLAHELTHVVQQNMDMQNSIQRQPGDTKNTSSTKNNVGLRSGMSEMADLEDWQEEDFHLKGDYLLASDPRHPRVISYLIRAKLRIRSALASGLKWGFETVSNDKVFIKIWNYTWEYTLQERTTRLENLLTILDKTIDLITNKDIPLLNNQWGTVSVNTTIASAAFGPFFAYVEKMGMSQKDAGLLMAYIFTLTETTVETKHRPQHLNYTGTGIYVYVPKVLNNKMNLRIISGFETARKGEIAGELLSDRFGRFIFYHDQRIYVNENNEVILPY